MADENAKKPVPAGCNPLFLTASTQEKFNCKEREQVTPTTPHVYIGKKTFLDDIQFRGVISDFHPLKKAIEKFPKDELILAWDEEEDYGQNFFLITLVEAEEAYLAELAEKLGAGVDLGAGAEGGEGGGEGGAAYVVEEYKPPESKKWVSQGSEAEIAGEAVVEMRERYVMRISRPRRDMGAPHRFSDREAQDDPNMPQNDCRAYKDPNFELRRMEHDVGVQALPESVDAKTQTLWFKPVNKAIQYTPRELNTKDISGVLRSTGLRQFLRSIRDRYELALQQNETIDVFQDDFATLTEEEAGLGAKSDSDLRELQSFNHLQYCAGRAISFCDWQPHTKDLVVGVSCMQRLSFEERVLVAGQVHTGYILLWNFSDPIHPQFVLEAPGDVRCFRFCPSDANIVVGGISSGQIVVWNLADAREQAREIKSITGEWAEEGGSNTIVAKPVMISAVDLSHRNVVSDIEWLPTTLEISERGKIVRKADSGEQHQFLTVASDGQLLFWDVRKIEELKDETAKDEKHKKEGWGPLYRFHMTHPDSSNETSPVHVILEVPEPETEPCRLFCVTEEGELMTVDLTNPNSDEGTRGVKTVISAHFSACTALQRSPFVRDVHLSVGDWTFNLWKEDIAAPLFTSPFASCMLTCGVWSPSRPAVVAIGKADGSVDVWDLLDRSHEPSLTVNITSAAVMTMQFHATSTKQLLAVGDDQGTVHVMEVPRNLRRPANNEKAFTANFFEREVKRVNYVAQRAAQRAEQAVEGADAGTDSGATDAAATADTAAADEQLEKQFRQMELQFKEEMGIVDETAAAPDAEGDELSGDAA